MLIWGCQPTIPELFGQYQSATLCIQYPEGVFGEHKCRTNILRNHWVAEHSQLSIHGGSLIRCVLLAQVPKEITTVQAIWWNMLQTEGCHASVSIRGNQFYYLILLIYVSNLLGSEIEHLSEGL